MSAVVIAGDTSGTITLQAPAVAGSTVHTLPATTGTVLNDATVGVCRAWVNFNGTGTVAIRASFNVSSITDNGTGDYTVNFTTAMPDASYSAFGNAGRPADGYNAVGFDSNTHSTSQVKFYTKAGTTNTDMTEVFVSVFR